ncbi:hypothetical protein MRU69_14420 [Kocuria flava]|uniref:hypothetical protein n=1 Tax=Kocuria flava TaxID=446860 RepID=UPI001FF382E0|nr:hypothetical protein [Kocuria flava]MCJ8506034.1 hypothetical protein [Kocuria flava]
MARQQEPGPTAPEGPWSERGTEQTAHTEPRAGATTPRARRHDLVAAERQQFGGMKLGAAFFGWLAATGMAVLLSAATAAAGAAAGADLETLTGAGGVVAAVVLFVAYFCGGYVAGRMARFDGAKQGVAVWLWAVLALIVVAVLALATGDRLELPGGVGLPRPSADAGTGAAVLALVVGGLVSLAGAVLGGLAGMRFHRRVDRVAAERQSPAAF